MNTQTTHSASQGRAVLVTGCSSGIGHTAARYLARQGFTVFAAVRKARDAAALEQLGEPGLVPVCPLDLAQPAHLPGVMETIQTELRRRAINGLYAIVNNAGAGELAPVELMDLDAYRADLLARLVGPVGLLQAFLPLIRQARGRVLWITTPALMPIPYVASIHACDFAVNCLARTLDLELKPWGIPSIMIRCGGVQTTAAQRTVQELQERLRCWPPERSALYAGSLQEELEAQRKFDQKRSSPEAVARVVCQALTARRPRRRYAAGYLSGLAGLVELFPQEIVDRMMATRR